jgi:hypothetical protein
MLKALAADSIFWEPNGQQESQNGIDRGFGYGGTHHGEKICLYPRKAAAQ